MAESDNRKRAFSEASKDKMRAAALARHDNNAQAIIERVHTVMETIQKEMTANNGIYPQNKGAVSLAEVARRAEIHPVTFHKERYIGLAQEVRDWLGTLKQGAIVGRMRVRKELETRVQEWKQLYDDLLETHRISETDLAYANEKLNEALQEIETLRQRVAELTKLKVMPLRPRKV